jgi:hypothetical protein
MCDIIWLTRCFLPDLIANLLTISPESCNGKTDDDVSVEFFGGLTVESDRTRAIHLVGLPRDGWIQVPAAISLCFVLYSINSTQGMSNGLDNTGYSVKDLPLMSVSGGRYCVM